MDSAQSRNARSSQPLYLGVYGTLRDALHKGEWQVGASFPSEAQLADRFRVSRITIRHALRLLEGEGYIRKARARRPVVVTTRRLGAAVGSSNRSTTSSLWLATRGSRYKPGDARHPKPDAKLLGLPAKTRLPCLRSVLVRDQKPYARSDHLLSARNRSSRCPASAFDDTVVFRVLQRELGIRLDDVRLTIWAEPATIEDAASLRCELGAPFWSRSSFTAMPTGTPVELAHSRSLASEVRLSTSLKTRCAVLDKAAAAKLL